jgi:hypothetical protein
MMATIDDVVERMRANGNPNVTRQWVDTNLQVRRMSPDDWIALDDARNIEFAAQDDSPEPELTDVQKEKYMHLTVGLMKGL